MRSRACARGIVPRSRKINPDHLVPAGQSVTDIGRYPINQLMPEQARLAQIKKDDVKATLIVSKVVFTDNSIGEYAQ
jgi:hypothetical protein